MAALPAEESWWTVGLVTGRAKQRRQHKSSLDPSALASTSTSPTTPTTHPPPHRLHFRDLNALRHSQVHGAHFYSSITSLSSCCLLCHWWRFVLRLPVSGHKLHVLPDCLLAAWTGCPSFQARLGRYLLWKEAAFLSVSLTSHSLRCGCKKQCLDRPAFRWFPDHIFGFQGMDAPSRKRFRGLIKYSIGQWAADESSMSLISRPCPLRRVPNAQLPAELQMAKELPQFPIAAAWYRRSLIVKLVMLSTGHCSIPASEKIWCCAVIEPLKMC
ncbi:hypothetical protein NMY22_g18597 [Coprinellus aureogranulatus]|nr:hypothetical protein NMY22_g18597 [Coprinellus aureogranulatus]